MFRHRNGYVPAIMILAMKARKSMAVPVSIGTILPLAVHSVRRLFASKR